MGRNTRKLADFGTEVHPLRCSALPLLVACPWRATMLYLELLGDASGKAADTGSAVHKAVETWHQNGQDYTGAINAMQHAFSDYPLADLGDAELHFRPYTRDPRNVGADIVAAERKVTFSLTPAAGDPTQAPIVVRGTLDQIRRVGGVLYLYDLKTGERLEGWDMLHHYAFQVAAYCIGATALLGEPVQPGALIRTRGYRKRGVRAETEPPGVFWHYSWDLAACDGLLDAVRFAVAAVRSGRAWAGPGDHCGFCPAKGLDNCLPMYHKERINGTGNQ